MKVKDFYDEDKWEKTKESNKESKISRKRQDDRHNMWKSNLKKNTF